MKGYIQYLKIFYFIEIVLGLIITIYMTMFMAMMATDSPSSTIIHMISGGFIGFLVVFLPTVLLPGLAIKELGKYEVQRKLKLNILNTIIVFFTILMPLAFLNFFILYKIRIHNKTQEPIVNPKAG